jgi:hypothetical protein
MSLKAIHIVFVSASILLAIGFGIWEVLNYRAEHRTADLWYGIGSFVAGAALVVYGRAILKKLKHISYL